MRNLFKIILLILALIILYELIGLVIVFLLPIFAVFIARPLVNGFQDYVSWSSDQAEQHIYSQIQLGSHIVRVYVDDAACYFFDASDFYSAMNDYIPKKQTKASLKAAWKTRIHRRDVLHPDAVQKVLRSTLVPGRFKAQFERQWASLQQEAPLLYRLESNEKINDEM